MMNRFVIFGDSYSTHKDYIPEGYAYYYCDEGIAPEHPVTKMQMRETWWGQLMERTDATLVLNDSWSGSTIGYTGYDGDCSTSSSFIYRYRKLMENGFFAENEVDTIHVFGGTNDTMTRLMAPLLAFTAEEIWQAMPRKAGDVKESIFLNEMPEFDETLTFPEITARYNELFALRDHVMKALELARAEKRIGKSLDAKVTVYAEGAAFNTLKAFESELPTLFIVSQVALENAAAPADVVTEEGAPIAVAVAAAEGEKCDRCWNYTTNAFHDGEDGVLCPRCKAVLGL